MAAGNQASNCPQAHLGIRKVLAVPARATNTNDGGGQQRWCIGANMIKGIATAGLSCRDPVAADGRPRCCWAQWGHRLTYIPQLDMRLALSVIVTKRAGSPYAFLYSLISKQISCRRDNTTIIHYLCSSQTDSADPPTGAGVYSSSSCRLGPTLNPDQGPVLSMGYHAYWSSLSRAWQRPYALHCIDEAGNWKLTRKMKQIF